MRRAIALAGAAALVAGCSGGAPPSPTGGRAAINVGPGREFTAIQPAIDAAADGATITVFGGTYAEHLVITRSLTLTGYGAILDGQASGLNGRDVGVTIHANGVTLQGFVVRGFERGVLAEFVSGVFIRNNEVRDNTSKDPQPISAGVTKADGIYFVQVQDGVISNNSVHDNGTIGISLTKSSGGNRVTGNRLVNNGTQQPPMPPLPAGGQYGTGVSTSGGNDTRNVIADNDISGSHWGIYLGSAADSANTIENNRIHGNGRAGIAVFGQHNRIANNDVTGNGLLNISPSCGLDLYDRDVVDNDWIDNTGTFGAAGGSITLC